MNSDAFSARNYRNPFSLLGLDPSELQDPSALKKAKQRMIAEANLSDDGVYQSGDITLNKYEIDQLFIELEQLEDRDFYITLLQYSDLERFLSGKKDYNLEKVFKSGIWHIHTESTQRIKNAFVEQYSHRLKTAVMAQKNEEIQKLCSVLSIEDYGIDIEKLYRPTIEYLEGQISDLNSSLRSDFWLDYNFSNLYEYVNSHFPANTLNLLPDFFEKYRDRLCLALLQAAKPSLRYNNRDFYQTAEKIVSYYKRSTQGKNACQNEINNTWAWAENQGGNTRHPGTQRVAGKIVKRAKSQPEPQSATGCNHPAIGIIIGIIALLRIFLAIGKCNSSSSSSRNRVDYTPPSIHYEEPPADKYKRAYGKKLSDYQKNEAVQKLESGKELGYAELHDEQPKCIGAIGINKGQAVVTLPAMTNGKTLLCYVVERFGNLRIILDERVVGKDANFMYWPYRDDGMELFIVEGDKWDSKAKNPCGGQGYVGGKLKYYYVSRPSVTRVTWQGVRRTPTVLNVQYSTEQVTPIVKSEWEELLMKNIGSPQEG